MENTMYERFKNVLHELDISSAEMASRIGVTRSAIGQVINGERPLSGKMVEGIAREFPDVDIRYLLTGEAMKGVVEEGGISSYGYNPLQEKDKQIEALHEMIKQLISKIPDAEPSQDQ